MRGERMRQRSRSTPERFVAGPIRTTWLDPDTRLIHAVNIDGIRIGERGGRFAEEIVTDCGIVVYRVTVEDDGDISCAICLESEWLEETAKALDVEEPVTAFRGAPNDREYA